MNHKTVLKLTPLAASLMVAMSGVAYAAAPAANALPGAFLTNNAGTTSYNISASNAGTISVPTGNTVIQFGGTTNATITGSVAPTLNPATLAGVTTVAGFNIGASATLGINLSATSGAANVLVSDLTGQASNIYGTLSPSIGGGALFVANPNGVVVGGSAKIQAGTGPVGLVGYQADAANFATAGQVTVGLVGGTAPSLGNPGTPGTSTPTAGGAVTVTDGASINAGYLLVAGAGQVNVGATAIPVYVAGGSSLTAGSTGVSLGAGLVSSSAVVNLGSNSGSLSVSALGAAGAVNVLSTVGVNSATVGGTLTNNANLTLGGASSIKNFANNANATVAPSASFGSITNSANLVAQGALSFGGAFVNAGKASVGGALLATSSSASVSNAGMLTGTGTGGIVAPIAASTLASFTNTGTLYDGGNGVNIQAGTVNLGGTLANSSTNATMGNVAVNAITGNLTGSAALTASSVNLQAQAGNVNYTGAVAAPSVYVSAVTGAAALGAVNMGTAGSLQVNAGNGNVTLNGAVASGNVYLNATGGSVLINGAITAAAGGVVQAIADNQILVSANVNATSTGAVLFTTNKVWSGPYSLGVVLMPTGNVTTGFYSVDVAANKGNAGNALQYGNVSAASGFLFTGNSYYQGAGASINTSTATFNYGFATSGGVITGGIVNNPTNPQPSNGFFNGVVVGGSNASAGVSLTVNPKTLGSAVDNVNLMGIGNTTLATSNAVSPIFGSTGSTVINTGFVPSNLFIRAQGGNLSLTPNAAAGFYWPGLIYASTVKSGMMATVDTTKTLTVTGAGALSNALPYQATSGAGMYLATGKISTGDLTVNTNSNVNVLSSLQLAGLNLWTASAPTGLVLNYNATLPPANVVSYTPPAY